MESWSLLQISSLVCFIAIVIKACNRTLIDTLLKNTLLQQSCLVASLVIAGLWSIKAGILPNLTVHILGMTTITLIFGWRFATLIATLTLILLLIFSELGIEQLGVTAVANAFLPIAVSYLVFLASYQYLARHVFVYIFVCAFLSAALCAALHIGFMSALLLWQDAYPWQQIYDNYTILAALIWFPEATINGMVITLLIIYRPHWVKTFYDKDYLSQ